MPLPSWSNKNTVSCCCFGKKQSNKPTLKQSQNNCPDKTCCIMYLHGVECVFFVKQGIDTCHHVTLERFQHLTAQRIIYIELCILIKFITPNLTDRIFVYFYNTSTSNSFNTNFLSKVRYMHFCIFFFYIGLKLINMQY